MCIGKLIVGVWDWAPQGGLGSSGGLDKRAQPECWFAPGLWQLCEVAMGVRLFSLFNRDLQDPVDSQVEMDFGVLL